MDDICFYIITPVYKAEAFLADCVRSVQEQTYSNFRLILVDDASPDRSGAMCDDFAAADSRIHVIHQANTGPFGARRAGIRYVQEHAAPGSFVMFLDSDDSYRPHTLQTVWDTIQRKNCDLVIFGVDNVYQGEIVQHFRLDRAYIGTVTDKRHLYKLVFGYYWYNPLWRKAIRVDTFDREDHPEWYHIRFGEDLLQSLCVYKNCEKAVFIPDVLYNYTTNPASATNTVRYDNYRVNSLVHSVVWQFLKEEKLWTDADYADYLVWCRHLAQIEVWTIAKFQTSLKNRFRLLDQLGEDEYYRMVIASAPPKDYALTLVRKRIYLPLCLVGSMLKAAGNARRFVRKLLKK